MKAFLWYAGFQDSFQNSVWPDELCKVQTMSLNIIKHLQFGITEKFKFGFCHQAHLIFGVFKDSKPWEHLHKANIGHLVTGNNSIGLKKTPTFNSGSETLPTCGTFCSAAWYSVKFLCWNRWIVFGCQTQIISQRIGLLTISNAQLPIAKNTTSSFLVNFILLCVINSLNF